MPFRIDKRLVSVLEYQKMGAAGILAPQERVELIQGELIKMSPIGSKHAQCVDQLNYFLVKAVPEPYIVRVQNPITIGGYSEPEPDLAIVPGPFAQYASRHPQGHEVALVIEVSDTSLEYDREIKLPLYAEAGIPRLWIFNLKEKQVDCYTQPQAKLYKQRETLMVGDRLVELEFHLDIPLEDLFLA